jgi:uncharacterized membrane protein
MKTAMEDISLAFEIVGVLVILGGFVLAAVQSFRAGRTTGGKAAYDAARRIFGRSVLLGLEVLVAADLIRTVAVAPTLENLFVLGLLVLIRTFLSWSLEVELEGMWPWQRHRLGLMERAAQAPGDEGSA